MFLCLRQLSLSQMCLSMVKSNLVFVSEGCVKAGNDNVDVLQERVQVEERQLAHVLKGHVPDVVVVVDLL